MEEKSGQAPKCACASNSQCCAPTPQRQVEIDFLYLDLDTCDRCCETEKVLAEALLSVREVLEAAGLEVLVHKHLMATREEAVEYKLLSSPTIRINGHDIDADIKESHCACCGDLCGDEVDCRVWSFQGQEYTVPPKALIVTALLQEVYSPKAQMAQSDYVMPVNLVKYFDALEQKEGV